MPYGSKPDEATATQSLVAASSPTSLLTAPALESAPVFPQQLRTQLSKTAGDRLRLEHTLSLFREPCLLCITHIESEQTDTTIYDRAGLPTHWQVPSKGSTSIVSNLLQAVRPPYRLGIEQPSRTILHSLPH